MRRLALAAAAIACATGLCAPASAAEAPVVGWWYELQQVPAVVPLDVPPPAYVPTGDLLVEGTAAGADAVAAVRVLLPAGQEAGTLTVPVVSTRGTAAVEVCATLSGWAPALGGDWSMRPVCGGKALPMKVSADEMSLSADVRSLAKDGVLDVLLEPAVNATTGEPLPTSVTLSPKTALTTSASPVGPTEAPAPPEPSVAAAPLQAPPGVSPPVVAPVLPGVLPPVTVPTPTASAALPEVVTPVLPQALPKPASAFSTTKGRATALLLLLVTALSGFLLARRSRGTEAVRGVGRYRSERTGAPPVRV